MKKIIIFAIAAMVLTGAVFGSAATINVTAGGGSVGAGAATVDGYTLTAVMWTLEADPTITKTVDFTIAPAAATVEVKTNGTGDTDSNWTCNVSGTVTCTATTGIPVGSITTLNVSAAN